MAKERPKRRIVQPCLEYNQGLLHEEELALRKALYASLVDVKKVSAKAKGEAKPDITERKACGSIDGSSKKKRILDKKIYSSSNETATHSGNTSDISVNTETPESARRFSTEMQIELKRRHIMLKQSSKLVRSAIKKQKNRRKSWNSFKSKLINNGLTRGVGLKDRISCAKDLSSPDNAGVKKLKKEKRKDENKQTENCINIFETEKNETPVVSNKDLQHPHLKVKKRKKKQRKNIFSKSCKPELSRNVNCYASSDSSLAKKLRAENRQSRSNKLIRAQRKFPSSRPLTPSSLKQQQETIEIQATRANTEDFLTFLCLRGHSTLPKDLQMFNNPSVPLSPLSSDDEDNETSYSPSPSQSQVLSPASCSSNLESSNLSTLSSSSHSEKVTYSEKHAVKAQAEFHQGLAGGKRARTEDQKLCEPQLTDTDDNHSNEAKVQEAVVVG